MYSLRNTFSTYIQQYLRDTNWEPFVYIILGVENLIVGMNRHAWCPNGTYILMEKIDINQMITG